MLGKENFYNIRRDYGQLRRAEIAELIGVYLLNKMKSVTQHQFLGLYRDDGLVIINNANGQKLDRIRKQLHELFKAEGLKITVELCDDTVDFLDVVMNLKTKSYRPYRKPNDTPTYVHAKSSHPPQILKNIPSMISSRLNSISSSEQGFNETKRDYEAAL